MVFPLFYIIFSCIFALEIVVSIIFIIYLCYKTEFDKFLATSVVIILMIIRFLLDFQMTLIDIYEQSQFKMFAFVSYSFSLVIVSLGILKQNSNMKYSYLAILLILIVKLSIYELIFILFCFSFW